MTGGLLQEGPDLAFLPSQCRLLIGRKLWHENMNRRRNSQIKLPYIELSRKPCHLSSISTESQQPCLAAERERAPRRRVQELQGWTPVPCGSHCPLPEEGQGEALAY